MRLFLIGITIIFLPLIWFFRSNTPAPIVDITPLPPQSISLMFAGDMMFDRHIRQTATTKGYDFILSDLTTLLTQSDLVIANLEGPITNNPSVSLGSKVGSPQNYTFTFSPDILPTLKKNQINLVNLGNNHIGNFGLSGLETTFQYLDQADIKYFGNTGFENQSHRFFIWEVKDKSIAFVNYNQFVSHGLEACLQDINSVIPLSDLIIVYAHWGNEYVPTSNQPIQKIAHQLVDAGADLIIGSHPHVLQEKEIYLDKTIYYSLGNFIFDQYFMPETQQSLIVEVTVDNQTNALSFKDHSLALKPNSQTTLIKTNKQ